MVAARKLESITRVLQVLPGDAKGRDARVSAIATLLEAIEPEVDELYWSVLELNSRARIGGDFVAVLEGRAEASVSGLRRTWSELRALAQSLERMIDGVFVGCREGFFEASRFDEKFDFRRCDLALEVSEGGPWRVHVRDVALAERLQARLIAAGLRLA